jgi:hypothetical protein
MRAIIADVMKSQTLLLNAAIEESKRDEPKSTLFYDKNRIGSRFNMARYSKGMPMDAESQKLCDSLPRKRPDDPRARIVIRYSRKEHVSTDDQGVWGNWQDGFINACLDYVHLWAIPKDAVIRMRPAGRCTDNQEVIMVEYKASAPSSPPAP